MNFFQLLISNQRGTAVFDHISFKHQEIFMRMCLKMRRKRKRYKNAAVQPGLYRVCDRCMKWLTLAIAAHSTRIQRNIRNFVGSLHFDSASPSSLDPQLDPKPFCSHRKGYRCSCPSFLKDKRMRECVCVCVCVI